MHAIFLFHASSRWIWNQNCGNRQQQLWVHLWGRWICCYIVARLDPLATDHSNVVPHYSVFSVLRWSPSWWTSRICCLNLPHCSGHSVLHHSTLWHCFCYCLPCFQHYIQEQKVIMTCLRSVIIVDHLLPLVLPCRVVQLSSPKLNYLIIAGSLILYITLFLVAYPNRNTSNLLAVEVLCNVSRFINSFTVSHH